MIFWKIFDYQVLCSEPEIHCDRGPTVPLVGSRLNCLLFHQMTRKKLRLIQKNIWLPPSIIVVCSYTQTKKEIRFGDQNDNCDILH